MSDTINGSGAAGPRLDILDHLDLVERVIRRMGLHRHHQVDEYRSAGFYTFARLAAPGRCDGIEDLRPYLVACIRHDILNVRRKYGAAHRQFVQQDPEIPLDLALPSREIAPDRMAMLREEHDLDNLVLPPPVLPRTGRRISAENKRTIRRMFDEHPTWGLTKLTRRARELTGVPIVRSTIRRLRLEHWSGPSDRERSMARAASEPRTAGRSTGTLKTA